ncbi:MAG: transcriptional regulator [Gammaproteobacteria bacterium]|nr:transcriptional regulator [Gammaproteobacteria bacterium]
MKQAKRKKLESRGWKIGSTTDLLKLTAEEEAYIDLKLSLSESLKNRRQDKNMSQSELARLIQSSQSRIAKMEAGDPSVSMDLLVKSLLALGASKKDVAKAIAASSD